MMKDLTNAIFQADIAIPVKSYHQNLQIEYIGFLGAALEYPFYNNISKAKVTAQLQSIQKQMQTALVTSTGDTKEHRAYIILLGGRLVYEVWVNGYLKKPNSERVCVRKAQLYWEFAS